ncbi:hypothetical protein FHR34_007738 [Kitasatospora kifunensis]|uniref:Uncharacterized protein n=1 Tax=Kitasatospora kifunensis TaxID=58351 RepID=A0A7W7RAY8_KITKI|nr:hypothetical protein [Kitasatospora kifunensis]
MQAAPGGLSYSFRPSSVFPVPLSVAHLGLTLLAPGAANPGLVHGCSLRTVTVVAERRAIRRGPRRLTGSHRDRKATTMTP